MRLRYAGTDASIRAAHAMACVSIYSRIVGTKNAAEMAGIFAERDSLVQQEAE